MDLSDAHVSGDGDAAVFIVDIQTGALIKKLETKTGAAEDPKGLSRPNGIVGIAPVDLDADFVTDALYATDLFGNVWAFDLSSSSPGSWKPKYGSLGARNPCIALRMPMAMPSPSPRRRWSENTRRVLA